MQSSYKIGSVAIKRPSTFSIERFNVTNMQRLASGSMAGDLIAKKRKFYFTYDEIDSVELNKILNAIWDTNSLFFTLTYIENNVQKTATVYVGSIPTELQRTGTVWVWRNVTFNLIER